MSVKYESRVTWEVDTNRLRCNPIFHGLPRYDAVVFNTHQGQVFAKLVYMFACKYNDKYYGIAYVQALDAPIGSRGRKKEADLGLYRLRARARNNCEFIAVETITRGALVVENPDQSNEYFVVDTTDPDMFVRMEELHSARFPKS